MAQPTGNELWDGFVEALPWILTDSDRVTVQPTKPAGTWQPAIALFSERFPHLSRLLERAEVTEAHLNGEAVRLFSWTGTNGASDWLSPVPPKAVPSGLVPDHRLLLSSFGGVTERAGEPAGSWLLNLNEALTTRAARWDASMLKDYAWAFKPAGIPINVRDYYAIAIEANGNTTFAHRETGEVLLFAPDHAFDHVQPLGGCPEYTLYTIPSAPTFRDWVETIAAQQLAMLP